MKHLCTLLLLWVVMLIAAPSGSAEITRNTYYMQRADEAANAGNYTVALSLYQSEIEANPDNAYAHAFLAVTYYYLGQYQTAFDTINTALDLFPKEMSNERCFFLIFRAEVNFCLYDFDAAYADLGAAIAIAPDASRAFNRRAQLYCSQGRYEHARADYTKVIELDPEASDGYLGLGNVALLTGDFDRAIELYTTAMTINPDDYTAVAMRGRAYLGAEQYDKAMDDICTFLEEFCDENVFAVLAQFPEEQRQLAIDKLTELKNKQPDNLYPYICLDYVYSLCGRYAEGIQILTEASALDQSNSCYIPYTIGEHYVQIYEYDTAITYLDQALAIDPDNYDATFYRAWALGEISREREAIEIFRDCTDRRVDMNAWYRIAYLEDNLNEPEAALADYDMAISLAPDYAYAHLGRADMLELLGRHDEALEAYRRVVELDSVPTDGSCAMYALLALGRTDEAADFMQRMLDAYPDDPGTYYEAACLYSRMGQFDQAMQYLATSFEKGYRRFVQVMRDDDLEAIRTLPAFTALMQQYCPAEQMPQ
ncbi:MAG: tetratricopeptide repeat protein [Muribaculaceae bacterium]